MNKNSMNLGQYNNRHVIKHVTLKKNNNTTRAPHPLEADLPCQGSSITRHKTRLSLAQRSPNPHLFCKCNTVVKATTNSLLALKTNLTDSCGGGCLTQDTF